jgi:hypothetical protein
LLAYVEELADEGRARIIRLRDSIYERVSLQQSLPVKMSLPFDDFIFSEIEFVDF